MRGRADFQTSVCQASEVPAEKNRASFSASCINISIRARFPGVLSSPFGDGWRSAVLGLCSDP